MANDYVGWGSVFTKQFPGHQTRERDPEWAQARQQLAIGQSVTGVVVARAHFGAWVDLRVGFPALLEITCIAGLAPEKLRAGDWYQVGSEVTAFIGGFADDAHQIRLWQVGPQENPQSK